MGLGLPPDLHPGSLSFLSFPWILADTFHLIPKIQLLSLHSLQKVLITTQIMAAFYSFVFKKKGIFEAF